MASSNGAFHLGSPSFADGGWIPDLHGADDLNLSPPLRWSGVPAGTRSFVLEMVDPDAPGGTWLHWLLFNIPASQRALPAGLDPLPELPNGARHASCWGVNQFSRSGYQGPSPPAGRAHRYSFRLHALDALLSLPPGCSPLALRDAMAPHLLGSAEFRGLFAARALQLEPGGHAR
jgi:hypothetical protein